MDLSEVKIDEEDRHILSEKGWRVALTGPGKHKRKYVARAGKKIDGKQTTELLHRRIMQAPRGLDVDHINGDGLDNRRSNLRLATRSQNLGNARKSRRNTSGYKGVSWAGNMGKWQATVMVNYVSHHLGYFDDPAEAHAAYCAKSKELRGGLPQGRLSRLR